MEARLVFQSWNSNWANATTLALKADTITLTKAVVVVPVYGSLEFHATPYPESPEFDVSAIFIQSIDLVRL